MNISQLMTEPATQKATTVIAGAAVASPWWLSMLKEFSQIAADLLPIAGLIWIMIQVGYRVFGKDRKR